MKVTGEEETSHFMSVVWVLSIWKMEMVILERKDQREGESGALYVGISEISGVIIV